MFHPENIRNLDKPKKIGMMLCMIFHTLGYYFFDCKYKSVHGVMGEAEAAMAAFVTQARTILQQFRRRGNNNNQEDQHAPDANGVAPGEIPTIE